MCVENEFELNSKCYMRLLVWELFQLPSFVLIIRNDLAYNRQADVDYALLESVYDSENASDQSN